MTEAFLVVIPEGYTEIDAQNFFELTGNYPEDMLIVFLSGAYWELTNIFITYGYIQDGLYVADYKVFDADGSKKIWVKFLPEA